MPAAEDDIIMLSVTGKKPWTAVTTDEQFRPIIEDLDVYFLYFRIADVDEWKSDGEEYEFDTTIFQNDEVSQDATTQPTFDAIAEYILIYTVDSGSPSRPSWCGAVSRRSVNWPSTGLFRGCVLLIFGGMFHRSYIAIAIFSSGAYDLSHC
jgi:hypothetical protein